MNVMESDAGFGGQRSSAPPHRCSTNSVSVKDPVLVDEQLEES